MDATTIQSLISIIGALMVVAGVGGVAWIGGNELRLRAIRRGRLATAGGPGMRTSARPTAASGLRVLSRSTVRCLRKGLSFRNPADTKANNSSSKDPKPISRSSNSWFVSATASAAKEAPGG